jgi:hypothetical protein
MATVTSLTADVINYLSAKVSGSTATSQDIVLQTKALEQLGNAQDLLNSVSTTINASEVNWAEGQVFTKTLGGTTTLTFVNYKIGQIIDLVIDGNHTLNLPATVTYAAGSTYDGTATSNLVQVKCTSESPAKFWASIINS